MRDGRLVEALHVLAHHLRESGVAKSWRGVRRCHLREREKRGFAVGPTWRGKGTKIVALTFDDGLLLAATVDSASPPKCKLVEFVLAVCFSDQLPVRLIGDNA